MPRLQYDSQFISFDSRKSFCFFDVSCDVDPDRGVRFTDRDLSMEKEEKVDGKIFMDVDWLHDRLLYLSNDFYFSGYPDGL